MPWITCPNCSATTTISCDNAYLCYTCEVCKKNVVVQVQEPITTQPKSTK